MSGESDTFGPVQDDLTGERLMIPPRDRILSGESRNITDRVERDGVESIGSSDDSGFRTETGTPPMRRAP